MTATPQGTIFVTGANGGLGSAIVDRIVRDPTLAANYHGLYTVRNPQRAAAVQQVLQKHHAGTGGHSCDLVPLDLGSLASVRATAADVNRRVAAGTLPPLRALVLNAGWQEYTTQTWTADGFDQAFQINYLSHFLLTLLLLGSMDRQHGGRIVVLGSWSHDTTDKRNTMGPTGAAYTSEERYRQIFAGEPMDTEKVATGKWSSMVEHPGDADAGFRRYGASKLAEVMMMRELSKRIAADPALSALTVVGVDPGAMPSNLIRERGTPLLRFMADWLMPWLVPIMAWFQPNGDFRTTAQSARDVLHAAGLFFSDSDDILSRRKLNGTYFNGSAVGDVGPEAKDDVKCKTLWTDAIRFAEVQEGDTVLTDWR
ncbi:short chain dehydrogenase domain-containing protein [Apiospora aurea]|uniref:3beta-hydroxysteroid 3-dehydrogenase n=1 Tax=Apiospora aurea TaxID=335848 RepID=A0ABR1Q1L9_9PEZI